MARKIFILSTVLMPAAILAAATRWPGALWAFVIAAPPIAVGLYDMVQTRHALRRVYPLVGHGRYLLEAFRPEIQQYFVENNTDGTPFSREFRTVIYQRSKGARDTVPFGTQRDVNRVGYEWMTHSLDPRHAPREEPRVRVGGPQCEQPYLASHLNVSAMSFGSLSRHAIEALNLGAKEGGFAHNTGEGGISPYHEKHGGDLIWQIGTGYFGCRSPQGDFDPEAFARRATSAQVKMVEIKLSQGAKPGHGGILPAAKITPEISQIRGVPMDRDVISPPAHSAFSSPRELLELVQRMRELSGGKPVGFKLCVGHRSEFLGICKAMLETGILPDFVTVDGAEGGTGAAPIELSNSVGMPLRDGLLFVNSALRGIGVRDRVRVIAAGKIATGFHMVRAIALGADMCNSARGMMFALGCIQARRCNDNGCPVGIATQDPGRVQGLVVSDKAERVRRYHEDTIEAFLELVASNGLDSPADIRPRNVLRRVDAVTIQPFSEVYEYLPVGCLLDAATIPEAWRGRWQRANADAFNTAPWSIVPPAPRHSRVGP
ncbi:MAG: FMN-binding glutamate synthase family protein [Myxococcales bacterium]|nr:FMN-binding glutamate synthase family protein [Myxococcales bacterium]